jgi:L-lactate dehydrogenase complex protein LldF
MTGPVQPLDRHAARLAPQVRDAVAEGTRSADAGRRQALEQDFCDPDRLRRTGAAIRQHALDHLDVYLPRAAAALESAGARVHFAADAGRAREQVLAILEARGVRAVVKAKSMVSEEIGLGAHLAGAGLDVVESDLGELVVQLDGDHPSHIVKPIIHKNRAEIAATFERHGLGDYDEDPETITRRARAYLRQRFLAADASISGANFVSAESGRMVVVTNEGNNRFGTAAAPLHVVVTGIEKVVATDRDLAALLALLPRSATGQRITTYTEFMRGPRGPGQASGPEAMHVVFVDNRRSHILGSPWREILRCIRCGACMNACPVYREASGHAYRSVYPGPLGAVLEPLLAPDEAGYAAKADLARASTLCGACAGACPVMIPLPDLLVQHRARAVERRLGEANRGTPPMGGYGFLASSPRLWRLAMKAGRLLAALPLERLPVGPLRAWLASRTLPAWRGGDFRAWMRRRSPGDD